MVCWIVPLTATLIGFFGRKSFNWKGARSFWLNIMLLGGAIFGAIDHLWNGELFLIGTNWAMDLALGRWWVDANCPGSSVRHCAISDSPLDPGSQC